MSAADAWEITVNAEEFEGVDAVEVERAVRLTLESQGAPSGEISVTLLDDDAIRELNRRFLGKDRPTDVLSFALGPGDALLGDVYIGLEQARRQADALSVTPREELVRLAVHGTLHVLGHDHPEHEGREECPMFALQEELVRRVLGTSAGG